MTTPRFRLGTEPELLGDLRYLRDEYSFDFEPADGCALAARSPSGTTSVVVQNLQLEIGLPEQDLLFAWGLHPHTMWREGRLEPPFARPGSVRVVHPVDLTPGSSVAVDDRFEWLTTWDSVQRWLRVASPRGAEGVAVEIATGVVVVVEDGELRAVWLRPAVITGRPS